MKKLFIIFIFISLQSCSPFENYSMIQSIGSGISDFFDNKTTTVDFTSGGAQSAQTGANYKVTYSFASAAQNPVLVTNNGYTVISNIKTKATSE